MVCAYGGVAALKGISLQVKPGQLVALIGANGAGKSTTLRAISGLVPPSSGSLVFEGKDMTGAKPPRVLASGIAHCPEGRRVFPHMTVEENLNMGAYLRTDMPEVAGDRDRIYSDFPRLAERRQQAAGTLSGGEQQMLAIGRAMMSRPRLIMFDEPSLGLAPNIVEQTFTIIRRIRRPAPPCCWSSRTRLPRLDVRSRLSARRRADRAFRPRHRADRERARAQGLSRWMNRATRR